MALILGLLAALWTASGYVNAFGRAMNRMYEVDEGRPIWKLRPLMILVTLVHAGAGRAGGCRAGGDRPGCHAVGDAIGLGGGP